MKVRELQLKVVKKDEALLIDYKETLLGILQTPKNQHQGAMIDEVRKVTPILDIVEAANPGESIMLTEEQWIEIKTRAITFPFRINHRVIVDFVNDIESAPQIDMVKAPG